MPYKLTDADMQTHNGYQWTLGEARTTDGSGELCGPGWLHYYPDPMLAVLLNPIHANYSAPRLFACDVGPTQKHDPGLKSGTTEMTLTEELPLPEFTTAERVKFAQECAAFAKRAAVGPRLSHEEIVAELVKRAKTAKGAV